MTPNRCDRDEIEIGDLYNVTPAVPIEVDLPEPIGIILGPTGDPLIEVHRPCGFS